LPKFLQRIRLTLEMIKFEHSIFALPFALTGALLAWRDAGFPRELLWAKLAWIVLAMVAARSVAMAFNRVLDADIDARNPRTQARHLPAGILSRKFAWGFIVFWAAVFFLAAGGLNSLCLKLAPLALAIVMFYSFTKRFTSLAHLVLGFSLGIAPAAAWIAMRGSLDWRILWLTAAVTLWTAGFDIIYACQDYAFDVQSGLAGHRRSAMACPRPAPGNAGVPGSPDPGLRTGRGGWRRDRRRGGAITLGTPAGKSQRPLPDRRSLLHHERLRQRDILSILGHGYLFSLKQHAAHF
jgi:putative 4-hydroxybenzoate polyprenyltransferase